MRGSASAVTGSDTAAVARRAGAGSRCGLSGPVIGAVTAAGRVTADWFTGASVGGGTGTDSDIALTGSGAIGVADVPSRARSLCSGVGVQRQWKSDPIGPPITPSVR